MFWGPLLTLMCRDLLVGVASATTVTQIGVDAVKADTTELKSITKDVHRQVGTIGSLMMMESQAVVQAVDENSQEIKAALASILAAVSAMGAEPGLPLTYLSVSTTPLCCVTSDG